MNGFGLRLLAPRVLFLDQTGVRVLTRRGRRKAASRPRGFAVVVLGSPYCAEAVREYPFRAMREIRAAAEFEGTEVWPVPVEQVFVMRHGEVGRGATGGARVNLWAAQGPWREALQGARPLFVVPEAAVSALAGEAGPHIYMARAGSAVRFAFKDEAGLVRSLAYGGGGVQSGGQPGDLESFRRAIGHEAAQCAVTSFETAEDYERWLVGILHGAPLKRLWPFLDRRRLKDAARREKRWFAVGAACLAAIWAADFGWNAWVLHGREQRLAATDKALSRSVGALIEDQERARAQAARAKALGGRVGEYASRGALLALLERVLPRNTVLDSVVLSGDGVELTGVTPRATELLNLLQREDLVQRPEFVRPMVRDDRLGGERFQVRFEYRRANKGGHP